MPRFEERLQALQQRMERVLEGLRVPDLTLHDEFHGRDPSGSVSITLAGAWRVERVTLADGWRRRLSADQLGSAVIEAWNAAATEAGEALRVRFEAGEGMTPVTLPAPEPLGPAPSVEEAMSRLDEAMAAAASAPSADEMIARLDHGATTATGSESIETVAVDLAPTGEPLAVNINAAWADRAQTPHLAEALQHAFDEAHARAGEDRP